MKYPLQIRVFYFIEQGFQFDILVEVYRSDLFADIEWFQAPRVCPFYRSPETGFTFERNRVEVSFLSDVDFSPGQFIGIRASSGIVIHAGIPFKSILVAI